MPVQVEFYLDFTAAAGRDLLCRKESSGTASPGPDTFNNEGGVATVCKCECMGQGRFDPGFAEIMHSVAENNVRPGIACPCDKGEN